MHNNLKELKFIHITKTAGTSIEDIGFEKGISWGRNHKEYGNCFQFWHQLFPRVDRKIKDKYDWFMVVRDPYTRLVSEYHFFNQKSAIIKQNLSVKDFNNSIQENIQIANNGACGHYLSQHRYLDDTCKIHVLSFENLESDFNKLMCRYNLDLTLSKHLNKREYVFTKDDFTNETIDIINRVYKLDFEQFNYKMIHI